MAQKCEGICGVLSPYIYGDFSMQWEKTKAVMESMKLYLVGPKPRC